MRVLFTQIMTYNWIWYVVLQDADDLFQKSMRALDALRDTAGVRDERLENVRAKFDRLKAEGNVSAEDARVQVHIVLN